MPVLRATQRVISAYAESEPRRDESWDESHDLAMYCREIEDALAWGVYLFRDLSDLEARSQARVLRGELAPDGYDWEGHERDFRRWAAASEKFLGLAEDLAREGFDVGGLEEFRTVVEEARCLIGLWDFEPELRPIEEARPLTRPENPRPDRYPS